MKPATHLLLAALALSGAFSGAALGAQDPLPADPATPAQVEALSDDFVRDELYLILNARFGGRPERFAFSAMSGPAKDARRCGG